jgi:uncharacterized protein YdhG (YjbR/CyaY superfamily)
MPDDTEYIHGLPEDAVRLVMGYRRRAQEQVGPVTEGTSYGMPALRYRDRPLMSIVATKAGYSFFPFSAEVVASALPLLKGFASTKGGIKFTAEKQLPVAAFDQMLRDRKAELPQGGLRQSAPREPENQTPDIRTNAEVGHCLIGRPSVRRFAANGRANATAATPWQPSPR